MKSMPGASDSGASVDDGEARIRNLQRQLDELKGGTMKVLRLARVQACQEEKGLLDSGATHSLRPPHNQVCQGEDQFGRWTSGGTPHEPWECDHWSQRCRTHRASWSAGVEAWLLSAVDARWIGGGAFLLRTDSHNSSRGMPDDPKEDGIEAHPGAGGKGRRIREKSERS